MGYHDDIVIEEAGGNEALLSVVSAVIFKGDRITFEERLDPDEVDAMLPAVLLPLRLVPFEPHFRSVATQRNYVNPSPPGAQQLLTDCGV